MPPNHPVVCCSTTRPSHRSRPPNRPCCSAARRPAWAAWSRARGRSRTPPPSTSRPARRMSVRAECAGPGPLPDRKWQGAWPPGVSVAMRKQDPYPTGPGLHAVSGTLTDAQTFDADASEQVLAVPVGDPPTDPEIGLRGVRSSFPSVRSIRLARWSTGPRCGLTDESSAPCWSVRRIPTHGRLTPCGN